MAREVAQRVLDELASVIRDLTEVRDTFSDPLDRAAVNSQIRALSHLWRDVDDQRASLPEPTLAEADEAIASIARDIRDEAEQLRDAAKVIRRTAQVIAIAEKLLREVI